jgi:hypothetical protein
MLLKSFKALVYAIRFIPDLAIHFSHLGYWFVTAEVDD